MYFWENVVNQVLTTHRHEFRKTQTLFRSLGLSVPHPGRVGMIRVSEIVDQYPDMDAEDVRRIVRYALEHEMYQLENWRAPTMEAVLAYGKED